MVSGPRVLRRRKATLDTPPAVRERQAFTAEIPGTAPDRPAWRLTVEMITEAQGDGERMRLRAHLHSSLAEVVAGLSNGSGPAGSARSALQHEVTTAESTSSRAVALAPAYRLAGSGLRLAMTVPAVRRMVEPLLRNTLDSWVEITASTADLADGAKSLLPSIEQLKSFGIEAPTESSPPVQTWAGPSGAGGFAQVSLLRFDRKHLPTALRSLLAAGLAGSSAFNLAGAIVNLVQPVKSDRR